MCASQVLGVTWAQIHVKNKFQLSKYTNSSMTSLRLLCTLTRQWIHYDLQSRKDKNLFATKLLSVCKLKTPCKLTVF